MAEKKVSYAQKYGSLSALIGTSDTESTLTMQSFLELLEKIYPYSEGWRVVQRDNVPYNNGQVVLPYRTYHVEKME